MAYMPDGGMPITDPGTDPRAALLQQLLQQLRNRIAVGGAGGGPLAQQSPVGFSHLRQFFPWVARPFTNVVNPSTINPSYVGGIARGAAPTGSPYPGGYISDGVTTQIAPPSPQAGPSGPGGSPFTPVEHVGPMNGGGMPQHPAALGAILHQILMAQGVGGSRQAI